ncbi:MAG: hypothetical protein L0H31_10400 [Nocardioidaceae bacterium]|nr:hypothetical protein [Nocardioidaceae bacterium]
MVRRFAASAAMALGAAGLAVIVPSGAASATACNWSEEFASVNWVYSTTAVTTSTCKFEWTNGWKTGGVQSARGWGSGSGTWKPSMRGFQSVGVWNGPGSPGVRLSYTTGNGVQVLAEAWASSNYINLGV